MKNIYLKLIILLTVLTSSAQTRFYNQGNVFIGDGGNMLFNGNYNNTSNTIDFGTGTIQTSKNPNHGTFSILGQPNVINQYQNNVNGFVYAEIAANNYILPLVDNNTYRPVKIQVTQPTNIYACYFFDNPSIAIGNSLNNNIFEIAQNEFWKIYGLPGQSGKISLSWNSTSQLSDIFIDYNDLETKLVIVGWNGNQWEQIQSSVDQNSFYSSTSSIAMGSISSDFAVNFDEYSFFTLARLNDDCSTIVNALISNATNWTNNGWSNGTPNELSAVIIEVPYQGPSFTCNSITLNSDVTLTGTNYIEILNGSFGNGNIILESEASLVQRNGNAPAPSVIIRKKTRPMRKFDYVYWGTPISGNFYSQINSASAIGSTLSAFDFLFRYQTGIGGGWQSLTNTETGRGFISRVKSQTPFVDNQSSVIEFNFIGTANNGDIIKDVNYNPSAPNGYTSYNLLANPYPSGLDAELFLSQNSDIGGAIYLWSSATFNETGTNNYSQGDYAVWNLAGGVATSPINQIPSGIIASGQGFKVKGLNNGTITFNNCMRVKEGNTNFFRSNHTNSNLSHNQSDRFWLALKSDNQVNIHSEILIAYLPQATYGLDRLYDADRNSVSDSQLYSIVSSNKLAINGRPIFNITDEVPVGISKSNTSTNNSYKISLVRSEGIFEDPNVAVFLYDQENNYYHNLKNGDYTFTNNLNEQNNRFKIVYQNPTLNLNETENNSTPIVFIKNEEIFFESLNETITEANVFDIKGSFLFNTKNILSTTSYSHPFNYSKGVYIVKVKFTSGKVVNLKLIK